MRYQKSEMHIIELCANKKCAQFQASIFIFDCTIGQKSCKDNDFFFKLDFLNFLVSCDKTNDIFGRLRQNRTRLACF